MKLQNLEKLKESKKYSRLFQFEPYDWQKDFYNAGSDFPERMLMTGNRCGKTYSAAHEVAYHATGIYPKWWEGKKFKDPVLVWCGGVTNESLRDIVQDNLIGGFGESLGTGAIPRHLIKAVSKRQCGIGDVADQAKIKHPGGTSIIVFKSYEQGWKKWQGTAPEAIWLDEEPEYKIFSECQTRILTSKGTILVTFTPLSGLTDMVQHFMSKKPGTFVKNVTWDDAPHLEKGDKERLLAALPEHEREARSKGIPMRGQGRVFPFDENEIKCKPFEIPDYYQQIIGIDFGWEHPAATVKIAHDCENDIIYITHAHRKSKMDALEHAEQIKNMGGGLRSGMIPVSWPHDGLKTRGEMGKGFQIIENYKKHDLNLLSMSARQKNEKGGSQSREAIVMEIYNRMNTGRFKVFSNLTEWFEEFRNYHRKDNVIVDKMDDLLSATFYAIMMRRFAVPRYIAKDNSVPPSSFLS